MVNVFPYRLSDAIAVAGALCVGLDPSPESLERWGLPDSPAGALEMCAVVLESCNGLVGIVKPQVGFFERFGSSGFSVLEKVIKDAHTVGLAVIADVKRGDIGSTMTGYASAWLGDGPLQSDAMTVTPYQGFASLEPAFAQAEETGATVFVLCATSNPDAVTIQGGTREGESIPALVARCARERSGSTNTVGLVVGATRPLAASGLDESDLAGLTVLAPGFGAQGAELSQLRDIFGSVSPRVIPSVSRSVLVGGPTGVREKIARHLKELGL